MSEIAVADVLKAEAEVAANEAVVEFRSVKLRVPKSADEWPLEVMEAFEKEKIVTMLAELLGPEQWAAVKALKLRVKDVNELAEACLSVIGVDAKN